MAKSILAIDDSLTIRDLLSFILGNAGYEVELAEDGVHGLECLRRRQPDVIVTDINMPRLDGFGFIAQARLEPHGQSIPILVLTTEVDADKKARARTAGATGWIVKPFNPTQLLDAVRSVMP